MPSDFVSGLILAVILVLACQIPWLAFLALRSDADGGGEGGIGEEPGIPDSPEGKLLVILPEADEPIDADDLEKIWELPAAEETADASVSAGAAAQSSAGDDVPPTPPEPTAVELARESIRREVATNPYRSWVIGPQ